MADIEVSGETCLTYYIDDKKKVLIDAGSNVDKKVDIIILTHCHYDHITYLHDIVEKWHPIVMASEKDADSIEKLGKATLAEWSLKKLKPVKVDRRLNDGDVVDTGSLKLKVIETPGHTKGSICLYDEEKGILFSGDTVFEGDIGRCDLPSGDEKAMEKSLNILNKLKIKKLYPGH